MTKQPIACLSHSLRNVLRGFLLGSIGVAWSALLATAPAMAQQAQPATVPAAAATAAKAPAVPDTLTPRLTPALIQQLFPGAEKTVPAPGRPPALQVLIGGEVKGYIFSTLDVVNATGFAGKPFDFIAGMSLDGTITGVNLLHHSETIIGRGVPQEKLDQFIAGFAGATLQRWGGINPDLLQGASTSGRALKAGMQSAALRVFTAHIKGEDAVVVTEPTLDRKGYTHFTADELLAKGSIAMVNMTVRESLALFEKKFGTGAKPSDLNNQALQQPDATFLKFTLALVSPASIGQNMFGDTRYKDIVAREGATGLSVWMGDKGYFSFMSNSVFSKAAEYTYDQVKIVQDGKEIRLHRDDAIRLLVATAFGGEVIPSRESNIFLIPATAGLDPLRPWQAVLTIPGTNAAGAAVTLDVPVAYNLPDVHKLLPPPVQRPLWEEVWEHKRPAIGILLGLLTVVTLVFVLQDVLMRSRMAYNIVRVGVLAFTLGWLGWWEGAQYSIVNILSYVMAPGTGTGLQTFLLDPLIFILGIYIAISLFVLGRGVFCGWLCPFGALQELTNKLAVLLHVPQFKIPRGLQERLWVVKYIMAIGIIGVGFYSIDMANNLDEVEPFKTAISVKFVREWPFVLYAVALLGTGLFVERFYCRFLCPLGGALAVFGRIHMFNWLKRKPQCGTQCRICESDCPVGAIEPTGQINLNECLQCLDCQVDYYDSNKCPPLIARKKRKEMRGDAGIGGEAGLAGQLASVQPQ